MSDISKIWKTHSAGCMCERCQRMNAHKREEAVAMNLKLTNAEAVAVMTSLQHYLKEVEKMGEEKGVQIEKNTIKGLIAKIESMPGGEVQ